MQKEQLFFNKLVSIIQESTGLDCREYNQSYIKRRLNSRILANNLSANDYFAYIKILEGNLQEIRELFNSLTINVTKFFRDIEFWEALKTTVFPKAIKEAVESKNKSINIWSCGCSSGEEAYSIAILLNELTKGTGIKIRIIATDIDELSLNKAEKGFYDMLSLCDVPNEYLLKYFRKKEESGKSLYLVDPGLKEMITFHRNNFFADRPPGSNFNMIFCRNVIIYFTPLAKEKLLDLFHALLVHHGWLAIGKSEILFTKHLQARFYLLNEKERIYRKERRLKPEDIKHLERRKKWWFGYEKDEIF
jgi:chemotaxis methyl-accepting protein methylase